MTRVVVLPADKTACGFYRMKCPAGVVQAARPDWQVEVYDPAQVHLGGDPAGNLHSLHGIEDPKSIDLLVMQRVGTQLQYNLLDWARRQNIATVLDTDDAMWAIERDNTSWPYWNGPTATASWRWLRRTAEIVDQVTVTTRALETHYAKPAGGRVTVLPNCVPGDIPQVVESIRSSFDPTLTFGWAGFTATHPRDLQVVGSAVYDAVGELGAKVRVIGDAEGALRDFGLDAIDKVEPVPLGPAYYTALTSIDVALVPLQDNAFNRAKSYLKALEFAAVGVPVIASDTPANRQLAASVPILLAGTPEEWFEAMLFIAESEDYRQKLVEYGLEQVAKNHTFEANAERWAATWQRAMSRRGRLAL